MNDRNTVIIICGPTAVGKTSFAIQLAKQLNTNIISADSRQCYKELNIGVAKPSPEELAEVYHYFINSHSIHHEVNAVVFEQYALQAAAEIFKQVNIAVMVGGTGLYIKAFSEGVDEIPAPKMDVREAINKQYEQLGLEWLQQQVQLHDPAFWEVAEQQNPHRLLRALEVVLSTGESITKFRKGKKVERPFRQIKIGLELPKEQLHHNINTRVDKMMKEGQLQEARSLFEYRHVKALQTVGYQELFNHFEGKCTLEEAVEKIKTNTRQYAKRQMTWFKKDKEVHWLNLQETSGFDLVNDLLKQ